MRKKVILLLSLIVLIGGCGNVKSTVQSISTEQVYALLDDSSYHIIDVRRLYEYEEGHLKNAILIPVSDIDTIVDQIPNRNEKIIVYCRTGNRSSQAAKRLLELGYTEVYDMGGIEDWIYEIVKGE